MASTTLKINSVKTHEYPTMWSTGTFTITRASQSSAEVRITGTMHIKISSSGFYYAPPYTGSPRGISLYASTPQQDSSDTGGVYGFDYGDTVTQYIDRTITWTSGNLSIHVCCNWRGYHSCIVQGGKSFGNVVAGSISINNLPYNPETPPSNANNGRIYSTNNSSGGSSGRNISDKPDLEVWWSWDGAWGGTPDSKNGIKQYNIDICNRNDVGSASSISETQNYSKNSRVSLFTLCRNYGVRVGGTLYCWVNTLTKGDTWLRKSLFRFNNNKERWFYKI